MVSSKDLVPYSGNKQKWHSPESKLKRNRLQNKLPKLLQKLVDFCWQVDRLLIMLTFIGGWQWRVWSSFSFHRGWKFRLWFWEGWPGGRFSCCIKCKYLSLHLQAKSLWLYERVYVIKPGWLLIYTLIWSLANTHLRLCNLKTACSYCTLGWRRLSAVVMSMFPISASQWGNVVKSVKKIILFINILLRPISNAQ